MFKRYAIVILLACACNDVDSSTWTTARAICGAYEACGAPWDDDMMSNCVDNTRALNVGECNSMLTTTTCEDLWAGKLPDACIQALCSEEGH